MGTAANRSVHGPPQTGEIHETSQQRHGKYSRRRVQKPSRLRDKLPQSIFFWVYAVAVFLTGRFGDKMLRSQVIIGAMAFVLGLYLGALTERVGSALPAIACHVANNCVFTVSASDRASVFRSLR